MKKMRIAALLLAFVVCLAALSGCSSRNVKEEIAGEWFVWHWYYNEDNGEDGFFEEAVFYTFTETEIKIGDKDGNVTSEGTYKFTSDDEIEVSYADGTTDKFQLIPSEHDGINQIQFMNTNTKYTLTLEPISSWEE